MTRRVKGYIALPMLPSTEEGTECCMTMVVNGYCEGLLIGTIDNVDGDLVTMELSAMVLSNGSADPAQWLTVPFDTEPFHDTITAHINMVWGVPPQLAIFSTSPDVDKTQAFEVIV